MWPDDDRWSISHFWHRGSGGGLLGLLLLLARPTSLQAEVAGPMWGGTGQTIFEHTRAHLRDPHFGMRLYADERVPGTPNRVSSPDVPDVDARAARGDHPHVFWDVAIGERAPLVGWYDPQPRSPRHTRGIALNLTVAAFVLLDLSAQSSAVINTDYKAGLSIDLRPWWWDWADFVSLSLGYFHQSTHLGDEYVLSAATIQGMSSPPQVNPGLPYRANPTVEAFPMVLSLEAPWIPDPFSVRVYGGATAFAYSELPTGRSPEYRAGAELHWELGRDRAAPILGAVAATLGARPRPRYRGLELAYEILLQHRYRHVGPTPGPPVFVTVEGYWQTHHAMLLYLYNLDSERSSSNAVAVGIELLWGRLQHGQLIEYATTRTVAGSLAYYW
jgi:hypothetical protein